MLPAIVDFETLGGVLENYAPVEDPTTDLDASADNESRANVAAMTQTLSRAICTGVLDAAPLISQHRAVWGNSGIVIPVITKTSVGVFEVAWPTTILDNFGVVHAVSFFGATVGLGYGFGWHANANVIAPNKIQIVVFDTTNAAMDPSVVPFTLVVY